MCVTNLSGPPMNAIQEFRSPLLTCSQPRTTLDAVTDRSKPSPARILVVYDNPAILDHVTDMLQPDYRSSAALPTAILFVRRWRGSHRISSSSTSPSESAVE
jgi:hypothetical protein